MDVVPTYRTDRPSVIVPPGTGRIARFAAHPDGHPVLTFGAGTIAGVATAATAAAITAPLPALIVAAFTACAASVRLTRNRIKQVRSVHATEYGCRQRLSPATAMSEYVEEIRRYGTAISERTKWTDRMERLVSAYRSYIETLDRLAETAPGIDLPDPSAAADAVYQGALLAAEGWRAERDWFDAVEDGRDLFSDDAHMAALRERHESHVQAFDVLVSDVETLADTARAIRAALPSNPTTPIRRPDLAVAEARLEMDRDQLTAVLSSLVSLDPEMVLRDAERRLGR